jgi:hypothetical protein
MNPRKGHGAEFTISTDASKFALGDVVLLQKCMKGNLHPCVYFPKCFNQPTKNYPTNDQELLGVVCAQKNSIVTLKVAPR